MKDFAAACAMFMFLITGVITAYSPGAIDYQKMQAITHLGLAFISLSILASK